MTCPVCGGKTIVTESRAESDAVYRRRRCVDCRYGFYTEEAETDTATKEINRIKRNILLASARKKGVIEK